LTLASHSIVQDFAIYILPMHIVWKLQMPRGQKIALCALLGVGLVAVAAGCVRFYYVLFLSDEADIWYYMADSLNWCSIEIYAGMSPLKSLIKSLKANSVFLQLSYAAQHLPSKSSSRLTFPKSGAALEVTKRLPARLAHSPIDHIAADLR